MRSRKISVDKKVELTPDFSGVDPPQSAEVRQTWDWRWSQSEPPPLPLNSGQKVQHKYGSGTLSASGIDPSPTIS